MGLEPITTGLRPIALSEVTVVITTVSSLIISNGEDRRLKREED